MWRLRSCGRKSVFGLTSGWWHLTDRDLRPEQPLAAARPVGIRPERSRLRRNHLPAGTAWSAKAKDRSAFSPARLAEDAPARTDCPALEAPVEASWVIFADESGLGEELAATSRPPPVRAAASCAAARSSPPRMPTLSPIRAERAGGLDSSCFATLAEDAPPERIVYLWTLDEHTGLGATMR